MSAAVLNFTGRWQGHSQPIQRTAYQCRVEALAFNDARRIREAKSENDDWTASLLLTLVQTLDRKQLEMIEFHLMSSLDSKSATQALALIQLATGSKDHRDRVKSALSRLDAADAE